MTVSMAMEWCGQTLGQIQRMMVLDKNDRDGYFGHNSVT